MVTASAPRRPGVRFEPQPPVPAEVLPRMDVAAFVGFATRGPLHTPVAVEDIAGFRAVFGGELQIAWDPERTEVVTGHLDAAVHAFFRNGGRRCWVVRVAGDAATSARFAIPGLLHVLPAAPGRRARLLRSEFTASSPGTWATGHVAAGTVAASPLPAVRGATAARPGIALRLDVSATPDLAPGDVLRARVAEDRVAFLPVVRVARDRTGPAATVEVLDGTWFRRRPPTPGTRARVAYTDAAGRARALRGQVTPPSSPPISPPELDGFSLEMPSVPDAWPDTGSWVRVRVGRGTWWLVVDDVVTVRADDSEIIRVRGTAYEEVRPAPRALARALDRAAVRRMRAIDPPPGLPRVELLRLTLWAGDGRLEARRADLGLGSEHPRAASSLPTDERRLGGDPDRPWTSAEDVAGLLGDPAHATGIAFGLAGTRRPGWLIPLFLDDAPVRIGGATAPAGPDPDGVHTASVAVFLDPALAGLGPTELLAQADFVRYQAPVPRRLRGIHSLLDVEEPTLVAVPDAAQPGWTSGQPQVPAAGPLEVRRIAPKPFLPCDPGIPAVPEPRVRLDEDGRSFTVEWAPIAGTAGYEVERSREPASWLAPIADPLQVADPLEVPRHRVVRPAPGRYRIRVRAVGIAGASAWSEPLHVVVGARGRAVIVERTDTSVTREVHVALLRMCAARGDLFAVLSLPEGCPTAVVEDHLAEVRTAVTGLPADVDARAPDLDHSGVLTFGALYHPWVVTLPDKAANGSGVIPRPRPPDGAIVGVHAQRAVERGAWVAPANVALRDVVALVRPPGDDDLATLHADGANVIQRLPQGFLVLAAQTLSGDRLLRQTNVRRLLSLLRRLALRHGATYVFEPNSGAFRRRIERGFDDTLGLLHERGAFAGASPAEAYRVRVGDPPNTPQGIDLGRLVVELMVAPAVPLEFLTVRLVRSGERLAVEVA